MWRWVMCVYVYVHRGYSVSMHPRAGQPYPFAPCLLQLLALVSPPPSPFVPTAASVTFDAATATYTLTHTSDAGSSVVVDAARCVFGSFSVLPVNGVCEPWTGVALKPVPQTRAAVPDTDHTPPPIWLYHTTDLSTAQSLSLH
jgi:hypothetical protein